MPESERALVLLGHWAKDRTAQPHRLVQLGHVVVVVIIAIRLQSCVIFKREKIKRFVSSNEKTKKMNRNRMKGS